MVLKGQRVLKGLTWSLGYEGYNGEYRMVEVFNCLGVNSVSRGPKYVNVQWRLKCLKGLQRSSKGSQSSLKL